MSVQLHLFGSPAPMCSPADSPARTSAAPGKGPVLTAPAPGCGGSSADASASSSRGSSSSRTSRAAPPAGCARCGGPCMNSAIVRPLSGSLRKTSGPRTDAPGSSSWPAARARNWKWPGFGDDLPGAVAGQWPTPTVCGNHNRKGISPNAGDGLATAVNKPWPTPSARDGSSGAGDGATMQGAPSPRTLIRWPTPTAARYGSGQNGSPHDGRDAFAGAGAPSLDTIAATEGGRLNPSWVEALMGFPLGWTELQAGLFDGPPDPASDSTNGSHPASGTDPTKPSA